MKKFVFTALSAALMLIGSNAFAQLSVNAGFTNSALKEKATVAKEDIKETTNKCQCRFYQFRFERKGYCS